ncbi:MAG: hypothetical protein IT233_01150 [Bacteroidia bacterium]|nr:hypothetical protein [Bacteroidia bacterium]
MADIFNNMDLLRLLLKWKKQLGALVLAAGVLAWFFSLPVFIAPQYKSSAVIYPSNLISYGIETPTEQMLQLFQSNQIRNQVIHKHNLSEHYGVDTLNKGGVTRLTDAFNDHVQIGKTEFEAVELEVLDENPDSAYHIILSLIEYFNTNTRDLHRKKSLEVVSIIEKQMQRKQVEIDSVSSLLRELKVKFGIIDYKSQAKEASREYYKSLGNNPKKTSDILVSIRNLEEKGNDYIALNEFMEASIKTLTSLKVDHDNAFRDVVKELTYTNVVVKPVKADKKSYPIRWVICAVSMISTFLVAVIGVIILERSRRY